MSPGSHTLAASKPGRLVFRPFEPSAARPTATPHAPSDEKSARQSKSASNPPPAAGDDSYGIDFELDDDDAEAIELVFTEYTNTLNHHDKKGARQLEAQNLQSVARDQPTLTSLPSNKPRRHIEIVKEDKEVEKEEEEAASQEDYHDSFALDSLLDLEYDDAGLLAALVAKDMPRSQPKDCKQPQSANVYWTNSQDDHDGQEIDKQILWEHEQWLKNNSGSEAIWKDTDIIDDIKEAKDLNAAELEKEMKHNAAMEAGEPPPIEDAIPDTRSPLDRWRSRGGNSKLSVSDLLSNMWCEQQYHYTLLQGFKRRTAEMQAGTEIHRVMEEEVHTVVPVTVKTKHDKWGVRIWNMIQGMESLRTTGLTRELEVWGWIDGVFINGVIDEVRAKKFETEEPDKKENVKPEKIGDKEEEGEVSNAGNVTEAIITAATSTTEDNREVLATPKKKRGRPKKNPDPVSPEPVTPRQQSSILDFITPSPRTSRVKGQPAYVLDLKTRASSKIPEPGTSQSKSVHYQLMLYRLLLNDMIKVTPKSMVKKLCTHHNISADEPFSDDLIAELAGMENETEPGSDELDLLLENNSIEKLYKLYHKKLKETISTIAPQLTVVYRWQQDGRFLASAEYLADDEMLKEHVDSVIAWWKGQRETVGVGINEAWKCNRCDFADDCTWRANKVEEAMERMRSRRANMG
ncbi:hypothetical protein TWF694_010547 [Orbilia ellipsospora]|uniref:Exonuclease V n=1 Tax=Orbilia ellipsospora TaxID=2528407 RepID=A0AAV9XB51_9PEZI